jgi:hypothetical protein
VGYLAEDPLSPGFVGFRIAQHGASVQTSDPFNWATEDSGRGQELTREDHTGGFTLTVEDAVVGVDEIDLNGETRRGRGVGGNLDEGGPREVLSLVGIAEPRIDDLGFRQLLSNRRSHSGHRGICPSAGRHRFRSRDVGGGRR